MWISGLACRRFLHTNNINILRHLYLLSRYSNIMERTIRNPPIHAYQSPWTKPLNWNRYMVYTGEERIPFHQYVQPSSTQPSKFQQFGQLPIELQFHILAFCSTPTLFQIMRVSSTLRTEAAKLFWSNSNTYYLIKSDWLFRGAYPGDTHYEPSFFTYVQNVEIEHEEIQDDIIGPLRSGGESDIQHGVVRGFWKTLETKFPMLRKVIITQNWLPRSDRKYNNIISYCVKILAQSCPSNIDVSINVQENKTPILTNGIVQLPTSMRRQSVYQPTLYGSWTKATPYPNRRTISMPIKKFSGPVGEFEKKFYIGFGLFQRRIALGFLIVEAIDRHYFDKEIVETFSCIETGCDAYFEKAGQWTLHALQTHGFEMIGTEYVEEYVLAMLPKKLRERFREVENDLIVRIDELTMQLKRVSDDWNEESGKKRRIIESEWINQLENDEAWATGTEARESEPWKNLIRTVYRTWE